MTVKVTYIEPPKPPPPTKHKCTLHGWTGSITGNRYSYKPEGTIAICAECGKTWHTTSGDWARIRWFHFRLRKRLNNPQ